jgi:O-antigen/teichoic acid export membrane protein
MLLTYLVYRNLKATEENNKILQDIDDEAITAFFIVIFLTAAFWPLAVKLYVEHALKDMENVRGALVSYLVPAAMLIVAATLGFFAWYIFIGLIIAVLSIIIYLGKRTLDEIKE